MSEDLFIEQLLRLPGIDEIRARKICEAGYNSIRELQTATQQELMAIELINPTIARWIYNALNEVPDEPEESSKSDIYTNETELDRKKIIKKIGLDPGRFIYRFPHSKLIRFIPYVDIIVFVCFVVGLAILSFWATGNIFLLIFISLPFFLIFIILIILDFKIYYQDILRIYEDGIIVSRGREGMFLGPPKTIWGLSFLPIWQKRLFYRFIPYRSIGKIYPIITFRTLAGIVIIKFDGSWFVVYTSYHILGKRDNGEFLFNKLKLGFGSRWESVFFEGY